MGKRLRHCSLPAAAVAAIAATAVLGCMDGALAQDEDVIRSELRDREQALDRVTRDMQLTREEEAALAAELESLRADRASLNVRLIDTAASIRQTETGLAVLEGRIAALVDREDTLRASLRGRSGLLAELLAALQRMGRRPPPAVLVGPEDALKMVRTAMLLGAVLPELRVETEVLASDLQELSRVRRQIEGERQRLVTETNRLDADRKRIAALMELKREALERTQGELADLRERARVLASEAENMQELIAALDREVAEASRAAAEAAAAAPPEALRALHDPSRIEPAFAFDQAKGLLPMPASGGVLREFGATDEYGAAAKGISITARSGGQVTSPSDGWVVYAGPFRSYGQLLILNVGDGYHVLLAGMEKIAVELGQFVLAGEPVGNMSEIVLASAEDVTVEPRQPVLYVEFRKDGRSIDPAPWWADGRTGVGG